MVDVSARRTHPHRARHRHDPHAGCDARADPAAGTAKKGDVIGVARIAAIQGQAHRRSHSAVPPAADHARGGRVRTRRGGEQRALHRAGGNAGRTGVEMEEDRRAGRPAHHLRHVQGRRPRHGDGRHPRAGEAAAASPGIGWRRAEAVALISVGPVRHARQLLSTPAGRPVPRRRRGRRKPAACGLRTAHAAPSAPVEFAALASDGPGDHQIARPSGSAWQARWRVRLSVAAGVCVGPIPATHSPHACANSRLRRYRRCAATATAAPVTSCASRILLP